MKHIDEKLSGQKMKSVMDERGISITDMSRRMDISYEAVSKWIKGKSFPTLNNLCLMAHILGVRIDELIVGK